MRRSNRKRQRSEEVVAKLRQAEEALDGVALTGPPLMSVSALQTGTRCAEAPAMWLDSTACAASPQHSEFPSTIQRRRDGPVRATALARHACWPVDHKRAERLLSPKRPVGCSHTKESVSAAA
jgi:hypothetical protein